MPIYEYQCKDCSHNFDKLQKMNDAPLVACPKCHEDSLQKQVTAPSFKLKGTGWYETDFKNKGKPESSTDAKSESKPETKSESKTESKTSAATADK
jgi:putative FmdB family regulatory protein